MEPKHEGKYVTNMIKYLNLLDSTVQAYMRKKHLFSKKGPPKNNWKNYNYSQFLGPVTLSYVILGQYTNLHHFFSSLSKPRYVYNQGLSIFSKKYFLAIFWNFPLQLGCLFFKINPSHLLQTVCRGCGSC